MDAKMQSPLTAEELDALEQMARAATPGPWEVDRDYDGEVFVGMKRSIDGSWDLDSSLLGDADAAYITAFDPPTVHRLLAQARRALEVEKLLAQFLAAVDDAWRNDNDPGEIMIDGSWVDAARTLLGGPYDDDAAGVLAAASAGETK